MKLVDLNPQFITKTLETVDNFSAADGINYDCPQCRRDGKEHRVTRIMFAHRLPETIQAWTCQGDSFENLTFIDAPRGSRSVRHMGACHGHYNIHQGEIEFYGDSRGV